MKWLLLVALVLATGCVSSTGYVNIQSRNSSVNVYVEKAVNQQQWETGLMNRDHLPSDSGMLFVFPDEAQRTFWMKNTLIPLDMIFADSQGIIVSISKNAQPCKSIICETYASGKPAGYVLEVNGGFSDAHGIEIGNKIIVGK